MPVEEEEEEEEEEEVVVEEEEEEDVVVARAVSMADAAALHKSAISSRFFISKHATSGVGAGPSKLIFFLFPLSIQKKEKKERKDKKVCVRVVSEKGTIQRIVDHNQQQHLSLPDSDSSVTIYTNFIIFMIKNKN